MTIGLIAAVLFSAALLVLLCRGDPKRRRNAHPRGQGLGRAPRLLLVALSLLPGAVWIAKGDVAALLMWIGGYVVAGWLVTLAFARPGRA